MLTKTLIKQLEVFNDNRCTNDPEISALYSFIKETVQEFKEGNLVTGELKCKEAAANRAAHDVFEFSAKHIASLVFSEVTVLQLLASQLLNLENPDIDNIQRLDGLIAPILNSMEGRTANGSL